VKFKHRPRKKDRQLDQALRQLCAPNRNHIWRSLFVTLQGRIPLFPPVAERTWEKDDWEAQNAWHRNQRDRFDKAYARIRRAHRNYRRRR
jgi:hypothetical protein